jgi:addiction module HigA family antidote
LLSFYFSAILLNIKISVIVDFILLIRGLSMPKQTQTPASTLNALIEEYQLNPFSLSKEIKLSPSAVRQLVTGKSKISVATSLRLAKFFDKPSSFWLDLQREADLDEAAKDKALQDALKSISRVKKPAPKAKTAAKPKAAAKGAKKTGISDKRKKAAKVPGAKGASRKKAKEQ